MKVGYVGIIGRPNVGKSTLLNLFLGFKLSPVASKPQTTRHKILGILREKDYQIIFFDPPGYIDKTRYELHRLMMRRVRETMEESDLILFMVEPFGIEKVDLEIIGELKKLREPKKPVILAINKVDKVKKDALLPLIDEYSKKFDFKEIVPISALKRINTEELLHTLIKYLPDGEPLYPEDTLTDRPQRFYVAEIIREKIMELYGEEIPYASTVQIDEFRERALGEAKKDYIRAIIYVEKDSQKRIIIGKNGEALKKLGIQARKEIEIFLGRPVYLELWVKTKPNWRRDRSILAQLGY